MTRTLDPRAVTDESRRRLEAIEKACRDDVICRYTDEICDEYLRGECADCTGPCECVRSER